MGTRRGRTLCTELMTERSLVLRKLGRKVQLLLGMFSVVQTLLLTASLSWPIAVSSVCRLALYPRLSELSSGISTSSYILACCLRPSCSLRQIDWRASRRRSDEAPCRHVLR